MVPPPELVEAPLTRAELGARYRALCDDPLYTNVPGKIELDVWGRMVMSPPSNYHSMLQGRLLHRLNALGGEASPEVSVLTMAGVLVADVAWRSVEFIQRHKFETPYTSAPELCIEVVSPSNSVKEMQEKLAAYLGAGAHEVWIVYAQSKRFEYHGKEGPLPHSAYAVDLAGIFD
jgi:Uma2 family endonuclease